MSSNSHRNAPLLLFLLFVAVLISIVAVNNNGSKKTDGKKDKKSSPPPSPSQTPPPSRPSPASASTWVADLVVASDGSGDYTSILEAVDNAPENHSKRFVIRIKAGFYKENVKIIKDKTNIVFIGDGINITVLTSDLCVADLSQNLTTYNTSTLTVVGEGFMAQNMTIQNTAGPTGRQAVALLVKSDKSVFYRCSFIGYQDTLYANVGRQFYRECDIYGTVDVIFGSATALFQNCNLYAQRPADENQRITFTAQGRKSTKLNNGFSIQNCTITAAPDVESTQLKLSSYLGRPWKNCSTTIVLQSFLGDIIHPMGWLEWNSTYDASLVYMEYDNRGPGSNTSERVRWPGYRILKTAEEARRFTVSEFLNGDQWLPTMNVPYTRGLM